MSRETIISLLEAHLTRPLDAHEAEMARVTLDFVRSEPRCAERSLETGHLTGSAWVVDAGRAKTLLTHHRKLDKWLQLGGHADGDLDIQGVARREALEESGLASVTVLGGRLFDVDRHWIPARKTDPAHWHYDLRFAFEADSSAPLLITEESNDLAWVEIARMAEFNTEESMLRMARKTLAGGWIG